MKKFIYLLALICFMSCKDNTTNKEKKETNDVAFDKLFSLMQGSFDSEAQAKVDSTYYNISLHMYPIWEDKGHYLYVEQALKSMQDKPYRQRIYKVERLTDSTIASYIYKIPNDSLWIGKWKTLAAFDSIAPSNLELRKGCEVVLKQINNNTFKGSTGDRSCESSMRGASFATSEVEITENKIISWDRGFDANGEYVWGAEKSGYIFNKSN